MGAIAVTGSIILLVVAGGLLFMWRRRAGRRAMVAQERIAAGMFPLPPGGKYPTPKRGLHRFKFEGVEVFRACWSCSRITPIPSGPIGEGRWLVVDLCSNCAGPMLRPVQEVGS